VTLPPFRGTWLNQFRRIFIGVLTLIYAARWSLGLLLAVAGCANPPSPRAHADIVAASGARLRRMDIQTNIFRLVSYARLGRGAPFLRIYIEGDGHAWRQRDEPSDDPTPWSPVALELAARDPSPSVAYLARPCQYVRSGSDPYCDVKYWTESRYAEPVIESTNAAIDQLLAASGARTIELVGFSGGGAVAALVAARRTDVANLRTVAANLDTTIWTDRHGTSPLTGSLNPADFTDQLSKLPQLHFVGAEDEIVELPVLRAYRARFPDRRCVAISVIPGANHRDGWAENWLNLLDRPVACSR
jgi:hypothetical protein